MLNLGNIGLRENFFEIGGHSLSASELVAKISDSFGLPISVLDLYQNPTIEQLVLHLLPNKDRLHATLPKPMGRSRTAERVDVAVVGMSIRVPGISYGILVMAY